MLQTKRVVSYGKRSTRIVCVSNDIRISHSPDPKPRIGRENTNSTSPTSTRKVLSRGRKVHGLSTSPRGSPKSGNLFGLASKKPSDHLKGLTPKRRPFGVKNAVPTSPSIAYVARRTTQTPNATLNTFAPFVDSDVIVIDESGGEDTRRSTKVDKGRRYLLQVVDEGEVDIIRPSRRRAVKKPIVISDDDEDDDGLTPTQSKRGVRLNPIVISDDDCEDPHENDHFRGDSNAAVSLPPRTQPDATLQQPRPLPKVNSRRLQAVVSIPATKPPSLSRPSRGKDISLPTPDPPKSARSPRRSHRNARLVERKQPDNPSPSALDLESSLAALSITDVPQRPQLPQALPEPSLKASPQAPQYLAPLLAECAQTVPHCFSSFVETFPFDDLHVDDPSAVLTWRKIGDASFSEVFAIGNVVLKIIPLRDEACAASQHNDDVDMPQESDAKDVLQEARMTYTKTYVVVGKYPPSLLSLWDQFNEVKSSENVRPDNFPSTQAYALLVLPHGGPDLEAYNFPIKTAKTLTTAEDMVLFEHRDLHWGQILVKGASPVRKKNLRNPGRCTTLNADGANGVVGISMDHPSHGVTATIIDLGLARMEARDGSASVVHWTPFDELIFEGEGEYQFDVYRMMRHVLGHDAWDQYRPLTNVMWLHYLALKLLRSKRLRPPGSRNTAGVNAGEFNEKQCYDCLIEMEQLLANCVPQLKGKKYRGVSKGIFSSAGDVVYFAKGRGWLK
ncbi:hypothetical protein JB92DRAFT_3124741 [Gautieria morchelliformis]|nr:hypothetical protein JB92DRAFT_3124741 [Gautieria morchelliformis]